MGVIRRVVKPITRKGKKVLLSREPKMVEGPKKAIFLRGRKTNEKLMSCMRDLYAFKKPHGYFFSKRNDILPFENATPLERFLKKFNAPLFVFGYSSKKRPNTLIIGRTFDNQVLDMIEVGVEDYKSIEEYKCAKVSSGIKPCLVFTGDFKTDPDLTRFQNLLVDFFRGEFVTSIRLQGVEHALVFTATDGYIHLKSYRIILTKCGNELPRAELSEIGPSMSFIMRRMKLASQNFFKNACRMPKELKVKRVKNISKDGLGTKHGRIHMTKQNISKLQTRKMKGLRRKKAGTSGVNKEAPEKNDNQ